MKPAVGADTAATMTQPLRDYPQILGFIVAICNVTDMIDGVESMAARKDRSRTRATGAKAKAGRVSAKRSQTDTRVGNAEPGKRPTLKTIATIANLGVTTVSRALKDGPEIGEATKERVRRIAREVGYRPDRAGVRLRTGKTNVISLILNPHEEVFSYGTSMIFGMSQALRDTPYHLVVTPHFLENDSMEPLRYIIETGAADGLILSQTEPQDKRIRYLLEMDFPFVSHGRTELATPHPFHDFDNHAFAVAAVERLVARGRRNLAVLAPPAQYTFYHHMITGVERAAHRCGATIVPTPGLDTRSAPADIRRMVGQLMEGTNTKSSSRRRGKAAGARGAGAINGFICGGDISALALMAGLGDAGVAVGRDVDVVAKQTSSVLDHITPAIDTIFEDFITTGHILANYLVRRIAGEAVESLQSIREPELRFRPD